MNDLRHLPYIFVSQASKRFPDDFMFQLTSEELANWRSQSVMSKADKMGLRNKLALHAPNKKINNFVI